MSDYFTTESLCTRLKERGLGSQTCFIQVAAAMQGYTDPLHLFAQTGSGLSPQQVGGTSDDFMSLFPPGLLTATSFASKHDAWAWMRTHLRPREVAALGWEYSKPGHLGHMVVAWLAEEEVGSVAEMHWMDLTIPLVLGCPSVHLGWPRTGGASRWSVFRHRAAEAEPRGLSASVARSLSASRTPRDPVLPQEGSQTPSRGEIRRDEMQLRREGSKGDLRSLANLGFLMFERDLDRVTARALYLRDLALAAAPAAAAAPGTPGSLGTPAKRARTA
eukprot:Hpha_TRINITY_DN16659_c1_g3::TRINITY_DN16659_c1_g3_i4::g.183792::m.183792